MTYENIIEVHNLTYNYVSRGVVSDHSALNDVCLKIPTGSRVLVAGQNGAGKSTMLKIIAGRTIVPKGKAMVMGMNAFHDTTLIKNISYLGEWWSQGRNFLDVTVNQILDKNSEPERVKRLCKVLRVDPQWKLGCLSDGQLRRAQILFGLQTFKQLIILDEITTDVDILVRDALLEFLKEESEERNATILYATHIFEGIEDWGPTHVLRFTHAKASLIPITEIPELKTQSFFQIIRGWLKGELLEQETANPKAWQLKADSLKLS
eukprot:TRINITY_DN13094_c1_g1_i1.p1 TRINITY_DN13094_c1_g1~~TRINITY_DN13094_c1_g1_i1.p1  ORF type:complete len:264 (+),score=42.42 TRINITY_DN13094_c1_g1_i1:62-853(+)